MTELRRDPVTGGWLIVAPRRAALPHTPNQRACPFCPGQEASTPPEIARMESPAGQWAVRVVANKYPLADIHEVIIESPDHLWDMTGSHQVGLVLEVWRDRHRAHRAANQLVVVFRNHSPIAGASQAHPHSQVIALPGRPPDLDRHHPSAIGLRTTLDQVRAERTRLVCASERFMAFTPYTGQAYEMWIAPAVIDRTFAEATDDDLRDLAIILPQALSALRQALDDPPYNLMVISSPYSHRGAHHRWYLQILPRLATAGGFEIATGVRVSTVEPETAAAALRPYIG